MRLTIIILTVVTSIAFGQNKKAITDCVKALDTLTNRELYKSVDTPASVVGGLTNFYSELRTIKIPNDSDLDRINILISFIVEPNGDVTNLKTMGNIKSETFNEELLALFKRHAWKAGTCNGRKVPTRLFLTIKS